MDAANAAGTQPSGGRGCLLGCIAFLVVPPLVGVAVPSLLKKGQEGAATVLVGVVGVAFLVGIFAAVRGLSKDAEAVGAMKTPQGLTCGACGKTLDRQRRVPSGIVLGDDLVNATVAAAYRCRSCGRLVCLGCAETAPCPQCGGRAFDSAMA